jgi:hypothetical protein
MVSVGGARFSLVALGAHGITSSEHLLVLWCVVHGVARHATHAALGETLREQHGAVLAPSNAGRTIWPEGAGKTLRRGIVLGGKLSELHGRTRQETRLVALAHRKRRQMKAFSRIAAQQTL